jgi:hypothetical protein
MIFCRRKFQGIARAALCSTIIGVTAFGAVSAWAAEDLKLRPGVSFTQDLDTGFPIVGKDMDDCKIPPGSAAIIFFGACGDLNTNRQAKRFVDLYRKVNSKDLKYVVIDVDHASNDDAKNLVKTYYRGYIPSEVLLDKTGKITWNHDGECELSVVKSQVDKVVGD